jgi:hypothetical protein
MNEIGVIWDYKKQKLKVGLIWLVHDNFIYFDTIPSPRQITESFSTRRFFFEKSFDYRWIGFRAQLAWQPDAREELAIPELLSRVGMYGKLQLFKQKVRLIPEVELTYYDGYRGIGYFPVTGTYHLTNGPSIPDLFRMDVGLGFHINFLKAFLRIEDLAGMFKDRVLYQADFYPYFRGQFRLGVEASFFN